VRVLITGAGRGLGTALARAFLDAGHQVAATARDPAGSADLTGLAGAHPGRVVTGALDVTDAAAVARVVPALGARLGGLDVVVNSAGANFRGVPDGPSTLRIDEIAPEPLLALMRVNAAAPLVVVRAALPLLRASGRGRVVNISSWLGSITGAGSGNYGYAMSKAALNMATRLLAGELEPGGIAVVAVNPGWVQTDMGGPRATLTAEESARGIARLTEGLTMAQSGRFLQWDGSGHPW
jgi:NAD(P)-dependent dehydrogenase (short-subunit alcohol dehydrogenase family)